VEHLLQHLKGLPAEITSWTKANRAKLQEHVDEIAKMVNDTFKIKPLKSGTTEIGLHVPKEEDLPVPYFKPSYKAKIKVEEKKIVNGFMGTLRKFFGSKEDEGKKPKPKSKADEEDPEKEEGHLEVSAMEIRQNLMIQVSSILEELIKDVTPQIDRVTHEIQAVGRSAREVIDGLIVTVDSKLRESPRPPRSTRSPAGSLWRTWKNLLLSFSMKGKSLRPSESKCPLCRF